MSLEVPEQAYTRALSVLQSGGIIAYPTESVYGLGCDPFSADACHRILQLKAREEDMGMIIIGSSSEQLAPFMGEVEEDRESVVNASWPGPYTWLFPKTKLVPPWIAGNHSTVAVRVPDHPIARHLCDIFGKPIVSTSANIHGQDPACDNLQVLEQFGDAVDYIVPGRVGDMDKPTEIIDAETGRVIREGA